MQNRWRAGRWVAVALVILVAGVGLALVVARSPHREAQIPTPTGSAWAAPPTALMTIGLPSRTPSPSPSLAPPLTHTPTPTPRLADYQPLDDALRRYVEGRDYRIGIAFVDIQSGQTVSIEAEGRYYALSTFKGPLAVYYLWLLERGLIDEQPGDASHIERMLNWSSNPDTTCLFERVGGIAAFNDWLALRGFNREKNFVLAWQSWPCEHSDGSSYVPAPDLRYQYGDAILGLPGDKALLRCPDAETPCDKAIAPLDLTYFYAQVYRGEIVSRENVARWLAWMEKTREGSAIFGDLPEQDPLRVYVKNGFRPADLLYSMHFYHEAGIVETKHGAFVLAVFMQGHPEFPGADTVGEVARIVYGHFMAARGG